MAVSPQPRNQRGISGVGLGLRSPHIDAILRHHSDVPWFELLTDNWLDASGIDGFLLDQLAERYPLSLHGVGMNIGGVMPLNSRYLAAVKRLAERCDTHWISDHLAFSAVDGRQLHDLAPLPYTAQCLHHCQRRIEQIQEQLATKITIENISAYVSAADSEIPEAHFLNALADHSGCKILLDINNLYVNQVNLGVDASEFIDTIKVEHVAEMHLAGFTDKGDYLLDAHNSPVADAVWALFHQACQKFTHCPTLIEWDNDLPAFEALLSEQKKAQAIVNIHSPVSMSA